MQHHEVGRLGLLGDPRQRHPIGRLDPDGLHWPCRLRSGRTIIDLTAMTTTRTTRKRTTWVRIGDVYGEIVSLGLRTMIVVTPDDSRVAIPDSQIWDSHVSNANSGGRDLQCVVDFYLDPEHEAEAVRDALRDVALTSPYLSPARPVAVMVAEQPWATHYMVKAYPIDGRDQFNFATDITIRGRAAGARLGVRRASVPLAASPA
ncbi:MAG: mechanosensitive ion channel domain-containing protein [Acidobacteriota bacterium]